MIPHDFKDLERPEFNARLKVNEEFMAGVAFILCMLVLILVMVVAS